MWTVPYAFLASVISSAIRAAGLSPMPISPMLSASRISATIAFDGVAVVVGGRHVYEVPS